MESARLRGFRCRRGIAMPVPLALLCLLALLTVVKSQDASIDQRNCEIKQNAPEGEAYTRLCVPEWALNHTFSASTTAPIATELNQRPAALPALQTLVEHMETLALRTVELRQNPPQRFVIPNEMFCSNRLDRGPDKWRSYAPTVNASTSQYGFGLVQRNCETDLSTEADDTLIAAMKTYREEVQAVIPAAVRRHGLNWPKATSYLKYDLASAHDRCSIFHITAFRARGVWGINTGITNAGDTVFLPEWERHYMVEVLRVENDRIVPIPMTLRKPLDPVWDDPKFTRPFITEFVPNSTTLMSTWGGAPSTSLFRTEYSPENNPGFEAALNVGAATLEQIQDALTASGMAILIAPIALCLLPLAIFAEVETSATMVYTIATDILTVFPLAIKGVELIRYTNIRHDATSSRVYGGVFDDEAVSIETWYADCDASNQVVVMGWLFLAMAIVFMIVGIALELGAKHLLKGKTIFGRYVGVNPKQNPHAWQTANAVCSECECPTSLPYIKVEGRAPPAPAPTIYTNAPPPAFDKDIV